MMSLAEMARRESVSIALGKVLDQSGYLRDLREERNEEAEGRIENLMELVSAAREYESREPEPSLGGFVDRLSLLSDVDKEEGAPRRARAVDDAALGEGARVSGRGACPEWRKGCFRIRARRKTKPSSRKSAACATSASRARARVSCSRAPHAAASLATIRARSPRAFSTKSRRISSSRSFRRYSSPYARTRGGWDYRANPYGRGGAGRGYGWRGNRVREEPAPFDFSQEDQSVPDGLAPRAQGPPRTVRRGHRPQRRGAGRRSEARRALRVGGNKNAASQIREAGVRVKFKTGQASSSQTRTNTAL